MKRVGGTVKRLKGKLMGAQENANTGDIYKTRNLLLRIEGDEDFDEIVLPKREGAKENLPDVSIVLDENGELFRIDFNV